MYRSFCDAEFVVLNGTATIVGKTSCYHDLWGKTQKGSESRDYVFLGQGRQAFYVDRHAFTYMLDLKKSFSSSPPSADHSGCRESSA